MPGLPENHPTKDQIEKRAYGIYLARGSQDGHDISDWLAAEMEIKEFAQRLLQELIDNAAPSSQSSNEGADVDVMVGRSQKAGAQKLLQETNGRRKIIAASQEAL
jgi:hypothetical protein